jgi:hypothetical protein
MEIKKISIDELDTFIHSDFFLNAPVKPISPLRALSYINNPNAEKDDIVLYMLIENNKIIAFRTLLPDMLNDIKFCWLSGSYVAPDYRGQKLSLKLLENVFDDWNNFASTNYTRSSIKIQLSTQKLKLLKERNGCIFYFYPNFNKL